MATPTLRVGQTVKTTGNQTHQGILRYIGPIEGTVGQWCGIELPTATGKNDGTAKGTRYFQCPPGHGIFVNRQVVAPVAATGPARPSAAPTKRQSIAPSTISNSRATPTSTVTSNTSKRQSIAPVSSRLSTARQSISSIPPKRIPASRPTSQVLPRDAATQHPSRQSISTSRVSSPEKPVPEEQFTEHDEEEDEEGDEHEEAESQQGQPSEEEEPPAVSVPPPRRVSVTAPAPTTTSARASIRDSASHVAQANRETEALKVKLRAMEKKRMEDRERLKQIDTLQSENEHLNNVVKSLQTKLRSVTEERKEAQIKVHELEQKIQVEPERPAQLESELELATIDKDMAEEEAAVLRQELEELQEKYDQLREDHDSLREENGELTSNMTEEERAASGWIHLEREKNRLRKALLLLRDAKEEKEAELEEQIKELRENLDEVEETASKYLETAEQLHRAEDTNEHLKEQLEAAENQEEVISNMLAERDRHLALIERLHSVVSELEELAETNRDLEDFYITSEKGLLSQLDEQEAIIHERERKVTEQDRTIEDLEFTLNKFRSVVQGLQSDIDEARRTREISEMQYHEMTTKSKEMTEMNMKMASNAAKSQTKAIEIEMIKAQARLSAEHSQILSLFLPESFDSERTPIMALLTFSKLKTKAGLVARVLSEQLRERGTIRTSEEVLQGYNIVQCMQGIHQTADRFEKFLSTCSPIEFSAFSNASREVEPVDAAVSNWLENLKNNEFSLSTDGPDRMRRMQEILADLTEKLIPIGAESKTTQLLAETTMIGAHAEAAACLIEWLSRTVRSKLGDPNDEDPDSIEFNQIVDRLSTKARTVKYVSGKITTELDKKRRDNQCPDETSWPPFTDAEEDAARTSQYVHQLCDVVVEYLNELEPEEERSYTNLLESLQSVDTRSNNAIINGHSKHDAIFPCINTSLTGLQASLDTLFTKSSDPASYSLSFTPSPAPWTVRAKELKSQRLMSTETAEELAASSRRNQELLSRISEKEQEIEEVIIRAELAEKRVRENKSKEGQDKELKEEIERLRNEKEEAEFTLERLRVDLVSLEERARIDRETIETLKASATTEGATLSAGVIAGGVVSGMIDAATSEVMSAHVKGLLAEIATLQATVRHLRWENRELAVPVSETKLHSAALAWLDSSNLSKKKTSMSSSLPGRNKTNKQQQQRQYRQREALDSLLDLVSSSAMKPVRLKRTLEGKADGWQSLKESTRWQVLKQKEQIESWEGLRERANQGVSVVRVR